AREVLVRAAQRARVVEREALAQEGREQDADIDAGIVERAQDIAAALDATAVQMGIDDHRKTRRRVAGASRMRGLTAWRVRSAGGASSNDAIKSWSRAALLPGQRRRRGLGCDAVAEAGPAQASGVPTLR